MNQRLHNDLKKHFRKMLLIYSVALIVGALAVHLVRSHEKNRLSQALAASISKDLLVRDYRQAILGLTVAVPAEFSSIHFFNEQNERVFSIPEVYETDKSSFKKFFESTLTKPIGLSGASVNGSSRLEFRYSGLQNLVIALLVWMALIVTTVPLARNTREQIIRNYEIEMKESLANLRMDMARQVSHDIRAPVSALNIVLKKADGLSEEQREMVAQVSSRMRSIAEKLLQDSSLKKSLLVEMDLAQTLAQIVSEKKLLLRSGVTIRLNLPTLPLRAKGIASEWMSALSNVLNNSIEAIEGTGSIDVSLEKEANFAKVVICDTGKGIPNEVLPRVFEKDFSFAKSHTAHESGFGKSGSGLGLYHCHQVITDWEGHVSIQSEVGRGTCLTIKLPLA